MKVIGLSLVLVSCSNMAWGQADSHRPRGKDRPGSMHPLMRKVIESRERIKIAGVRVVMHLEQGERKLVTEKVWRNGETIRSQVIDSGSRKGFDSIENNQRRLVWNPSTNEIRESPPIEAEMLMRFMHFSNRFRPNFKESNGGSVAGHDTRGLALVNPSDQPILKLWIDPDRGLILKMQSFDPKGQLNGSMEYTSVQFDPKFPSKIFDFQKPGAKFITAYDDLKKISSELGMKPYRIQQNDSWKLVAVRKLDPKGIKVLMQTYAGKAGRLSLFQIKGDVNPERLQRMTGRDSASYVWNKDGSQLVLIGNLTQDELRRWAERVSD